MDQPIYRAEEQQQMVAQWLLQDTVELEKAKEELRQEKEDVDSRRRQLEADLRDFHRRVELERQREQREKDLFAMKWRLLESEIANLANERTEFNIKLHEFENSIQGSDNGSINCSLLFQGVTNELALKKRYKDLMKIYHPDNLAGDTAAVQKISEEFELLKDQFRNRY